MKNKTFSIIIISILGLNIISIPILFIFKLYDLLFVINIILTLTILLILNIVSSRITRIKYKIQKEENNKELMSELDFLLFIKRRLFFGFLIQLFVSIIIVVLISVLL